MTSLQHEASNGSSQRRNKTMTSLQHEASNGSSQRHNKTMTSLQHEASNGSSQRRKELERSQLFSQTIELKSHSTSMRAVENNADENQPGGEIPASTRRILLVIKFVIGLLLFGTVLVCAMFSKLTLASMTDQLRRLTWNVTKSSSNYRGDNSTIGSENNCGVRTEVTTLYWQLFLVMILPSCVTLIRSFVFGVFGKTRASFPWPDRKAVTLGMFLSVVEVFAVSIFLFLVMSNLPPSVSILLLNGVFLVQIAIDVWYSKWTFPSYSRGEYRNMDSGPDGPPMSRLKRLQQLFGKTVETRIIKIIAFSLQLGGIVGLIIYVAMESKGKRLAKVLSPLIAFPIVLLVMSAIWSDKVQHLMAYTTKVANECHTARYKSSFINAAVRVFLYPFVSYIVFRFFTFHNIDPWFTDSNCHLDYSWTGHSLNVFLVQIFTSFSGYAFAWIACTMTLSWCGLALPLILSTPLSIGWYYLNVYVEEDSLFPFAAQDKAELYSVGPLIAALLWLGEVLAMGHYIWTHSNLILAKDTDMFLIPHYDGVFLEQQLILNRQTTKDSSPSSVQGNHVQRPPWNIFICSTMYREVVIEMKQMLSSIYRVAMHCEQQLREQSDPEQRDRFESHIFFDGAMNGSQLTHFPLQLASLLEETLQINLRECIREETPYGYKLSWYLGDSQMPFSIHLKDNLKVKNKKRWSQVMYMNYIINHRIKKEELDPDNTFILTTDADIDFTAESAIVLLDMLASNTKVGAVCARTHPKGSGPLYWYQVFDYAVGHWFQKPAEHILGCVLCCPGCFSVFRCKALMDVLEEYSSEVTGAREFLTKDMGEDRWLCTLLVQKGWRLEYCAISEDYTYCPETFDEFFKQRRRWIPSTIANLVLLISEARSITKGNDTVSILFILFQAVLVFSTMISPATVILIITSGLGSAYHLSGSAQIAVIVVLCLVSVGYGIVCLYTKQKTQLDVAKLLTFIFAIVMAVVIAGIFKETILDIINSSDEKGITTLGPVTCTGNSTTKFYEDCKKSAAYLGSLQNITSDEPFQLPVSINTIYTGAFAITFVLAAVLHFPEWSCLLQFIWYLIALPSGYLLLLLYSAANLDSQSWGTREGKSGGGDEAGYKMFKNLVRNTVSFFSRCFGSKEDKKEKVAPQEVKKEEVAPQEVKKEVAAPQEKPSETVDSSEPSATEEAGEATVEVRPKLMDRRTKQWLTEQGCECSVERFQEHGYVNEHFIASMKAADFEAIGIQKRGFRLRLEKAAKKLPSLPIETDVPTSVAEWLRRLEMEEYADLFCSEGYEKEDDIENLKDLKKEDFQAMGIHKRAHLQRLESGLNGLFYPSAVDLQIRKTKGTIENIAVLPLRNNEEKTFWEDLIKKKLKPMRVRLTQTEELKQNLKSLRNTTLAVLLLVNLMWIILLYTLTFPELDEYDLPTRAFSLLFLAVYGVIIAIQFFTMICHRVVTLVHYLGRIKRGIPSPHPFQHIDLRRDSVIA